MSPDRKPIIPQAELDIDEFYITARDGHAIRVRRYTSNTDKAARPVLVYLHGGGYVKGGLETDDEMCRAIAAAVSVIVLSVEYRLAPEHLFPTGFQDCHDVVRWVRSLTEPSPQRRLQLIDYFRRPQHKAKASSTLISRKASC